MRRFRKAAAILLAVTILALSCPAAFRADASDGALEAARELYDLGLFRGVGTDGNGEPLFELDRVPTRNEAVTMLIRLLGKEQEAKAALYPAPFTDVAEWATPYVGCAYAHGLTLGRTGTQYGGADPTTATEYLTFVLRALGYDSSSDFAWDSAWELSDRIGLTHGEYDGTTEFTRGDVALISRNALTLPLKGTTATLGDLCACSRQGSEDGFEIHFLDVGEADCAIVVCDGHCMLIDGGNADDSALIFSYLRDHGFRHLDCVVCTHPHEDHAGGLAAALNCAAADRALSPVETSDSQAFANFLKYLEKQGRSVTVPAAGDTFRLGSAQVQILGPVSAAAEGNNASIVLRIVYEETSFLFTGDAEREEELEIIEAGYPLESTLLKVGHHGSYTSTSYPFLYHASPAYAVISVGADNPYGHPHESTLSRLSDAEVRVFRTDLYGTVICRSDGQALNFSCEKSPEDAGEGNAGAGRTAETEGTYILNGNTFVFHRPDCPSVAKMSERNKIRFDGSREEALAMGYRPCGICEP